MRNESLFGHHDEPVAKGVRFDMIEASDHGAAPSSIDLLRDVPLEVQAQLGLSLIHI